MAYYTQLCNEVRVSLRSWTERVWLSTLRKQNPQVKFFGFSITPVDIHGIMIDGTK